MKDRMMPEFDLRADDLMRLRTIKDQICAKMFGMEPVVNALLVSLLMRGHVLLEGNPGLGKTMLVRALGAGLGLEDGAMGRIQFTPDLMPSDITGTKMPDDNNTNRLKFRQGPIFHQLLLADEINRATAKTQSAMLEAMAENQVTVLGDTHHLTHLKPARDGGQEYQVLTPFMVMATQNPIEQDGTNPLPEAQLDRFMFKIRMHFPTAENLQKIIATEQRRLPGRAEQTANTASTQDQALVALHRLSGAIRAAELNPFVAQHISNIIMASVGQLGQTQGINHSDMAALQQFGDEKIAYPLGPRAGIALTLGTLAWAAVALVDPAEPEQLSAKTGEALTAIALPALRHRIKFHHDFASTDRNEADEHDNNLRQFITHCAPSDPAYKIPILSQFEAGAGLGL